jgi:hypothetical protein
MTAPRTFLMIVTLLALSALTLPSGARAADVPPPPQTDHVDTIQELDDIDLTQEVGQARLSAMDVGIAANGLPTTWCGSETTTDDTADAFFDASLPQFKVIYAYPHDRPDRFAQWKDALQDNVSLIEQFVSSQPGSTKAPRFDMGTSCGPTYLDIQTVALPGARSTYLSNMGTVESAVKAKVNASPGGSRNYLVIADTLSGSGIFGLGELFEGSTSSDRPDASNIHNNGGLMSVLWTLDSGAPGAGAAGWWPEGQLHEMTHNLGGVQWTAPHTSQPAGGRDYTYSHCWDGYDVMCYRDGPVMSHAYSTSSCAPLAGAMPQTYDCGQDDYFNPAPPAGSYLATHWDVYNSVFMADCTALPGTACLSSPPIGPPVNSGLPTVTGAATSGSTLTATIGNWNPAGRTYGYQWQRDTGAGYVDIAGATGVTHKILTTEKNASLRVRVTATNSYAAVNAFSAGVGPVATTPPLNTVAPVVSGGTASGSTLTATLGTWSPTGTSYAYQWQRDPGSGYVDIAGATRDSFKLTVADRGAHVRVRVTAANPDGALTVYSNAIGLVTTAPPVNSVLPTISGTLKNGQRLTGTLGTWSTPGTSYAYSWQRNPGSGFVDIPGATASTYLLTAADKGHPLHLRVTATNGDGAVKAFSVDTGVVVAAPPVNTVVPTISGTMKVGSRLTGTLGTWSTPGASYTYSWQRDPGTGFVDIAGATGSTYVLTAADKGRKLHLRVMATNGDGVVKAFSVDVGPVVAAAASASLSAGGQTNLVGASGAVMASASISAGAAKASVGAAPRLTVRIRRAAGARGSLKVLVCPVTAPGDPWRPCTKAKRLGSRTVALRVRSATGRVQVQLIRR